MVNCYNIHLYILLTSNLCLIPGCGQKYSLFQIVQTTLGTIHRLQRLKTCLSLGIKVTLA
jgi:hypothetical protein